MIADNGFLLEGIDPRGGLNSPAEGEAGPKVNGSLAKLGPTGPKDLDRWTTEVARDPVYNEDARGFRIDRV